MSPEKQYDLAREFGKLIDASIDAICGIKFRDSWERLQGEVDIGRFNRQWTVFHQADVVLANDPKYWKCSLLMYRALDRNII